MSETAHAEPGHAPAHEDEEMHHHLSPWPVVSALGATTLLVGLVLHPLVLFLGAILTFAGLAGWVREDMHFYRHPVPELYHSGTAPNPFWGIILFLHFLNVFVFDAVIGREAERRMIERELRKRQGSGQ